MQSGFHLGISLWGGGGKLTDHVAIGHGEGEGVGGGCAPSRAEHERKKIFFFGGLIVG